MEQGYAKIEKGINLKGSRCMLNIYYGDMQESVYNLSLIHIYKIHQWRKENFMPEHYFGYVIKVD